MVLEKKIPPNKRRSTPKCQIHPTRSSPSGWLPTAEISIKPAKYQTIATAVSRDDQRSSLLALPAHKRVQKLPHVRPRHRVPLDPVPLRPLPPRQVVRPEQPVLEREVNRKIHVNGLLLNPMMPVM